MNFKAFFLILSIIITTSLFSQTISKKNGVYVDKEGEKYTGVYISYYQEGVKEAVYTIKNGLENGSVEFYYPSTEIMEQGNFKSGVKHGKWIRWSIKGDKLAEANYNKGKKDGKWIVWDERGIKRYEMYYTNGAKSGVWIMWDDKGQISNKKEH